MCGLCDVIEGICQKVFCERKSMSMEPCPKCKTAMMPKTHDGKRVSTYTCHKCDDERYVCNLAGERKILTKAEFIHLRREMNG